MSKNLGPIVSSSHLADGALPELSEFEYGLMLSGHAFNRWVARAMAAAGYPKLSSLEVLVLHTVHHRSRAKTLSDICLVLNVEDTHTVTYAIKKLTAAGLVEGKKQGNEKTVHATDQGVAACGQYKIIRERLLVEAVQGMGFDRDELSRLSALLRLMSGHYDQASRAATTY